MLMDRYYLYDIIDEFINFIDMIAITMLYIIVVRNNNKIMIYGGCGILLVRNVEIGWCLYYNIFFIRSWL